jgi:RNA polymerase sigma-70 factor, ECF subfamily
MARWTGLDNPQSYLYMIATNLVRDHWRKAGRERTAIKVMTAAGPADLSYIPAQDVDVRALIQALPDRLRTPFLLHYYAGFPIRELAAMLGRPEGTIKADLFHARARLKAALGETGD